MLTLIIYINVGIYSRLKESLKNILPTNKVQQFIQLLFNYEKINE